MVVFALCALYGRTSLGLGKDDGYRDFVRATASFRERAFKTFIFSLFGVNLTLIFFVLMHAPGRLAICAVAVTAGLGSVCVRNVLTIIEIAAVHVFS